MSLLKSLLEIFTFSITEDEKLLDRESSRSFNLNTPLELAPVTATLTSFLNFAI